VPSAAGLARAMYDRLPAPLRRATGLVPFGWRIGATYRETLARVLETDRWSAAKLRELQGRELARVLDRAIRNVPYYQRRYGHLLGQEPWRALAEIEPLEKKDLQADPEAFLDPTVPKRATYVTSTGGTSGQPLSLVLDKAGFQLEWAFMVAQWMRAGYRPGARKATFRGVAFPGGRIIQENPVYDELQLSPFAMSAENLPRYVEAIREFRPEFLYGYPSAMTLLSKWLQAHPEVKLPKPKALLCGSEGVLEGQRELLEGVFGARLFSWYGMSEKVILAGECEKTSLYHSFPQYGVTEILDANGNLSSEQGAEGELVGTGFTNASLPFIRYRTGDFSRIAGLGCEGCGREHLLLDGVRGRWVQEMVIGRRGTRISLTALNMHGEVFKGVERFQLHQRERGRVALRLVCPGGLTDAVRGRILKALLDKTGDEVEWTIEQVPEIKLSPRGKSVFLVQELESA
jgi:phenylacetate-CoA ligase